MATKIRGRQIETDDFIKSVRNSDLDWTDDVNTASQKAIAQYVASAAGGVLVCTLTSNTNPCTMDKTTYEIAQAVEDGKEVICIDPYHGRVYQIVDAQNAPNLQIHFGSIYTNITYNLYSNIGSERWVRFSSSLQIKLSDSGVGQNIKTINNQSILGSGNIDTKEIVWCTYTETDSTNHTGTMSMSVSDIDAAINAGAIVCTKRGVVVYYLVNKGTIAPSFCCIQGTTVYSIAYYSSDNLWHYYANNIQQALVSGTTIKTINNESLLGSGNISIQGGGGGGDVNVIEVVKVNGTALTPDSDKAVNINDIPWSIVSSKPTIPDAVSGTNDGTNWTTITIGSTTKAIPSGGGGGSSTLSGLTDTSIVSPSTGEFLVYDGTESKWVNKAMETASTSYAGIVQLEDSTSSTATNKAATPNSVKSAYDLASAAIPKSTGTTAGDIIYFTAASTPARLAKGTAGQVLTMNSGATAPEWATPSGGGLSNYDFTHTIASGVSGTVTVTFAANTRGSRMMTATADIGLAIVCNNSADNYIWVKNNGSSDIDVTINSVTYNNSSMSASKIFIPEDGITIPKGNVAEIGIVCNADGAFITVRADLKANS